MQAEPNAHVSSGCELAGLQAELLPVVYEEGARPGKEGGGAPVRPCSPKASTSLQLCTARKTIPPISSPQRVMRINQRMSTKSRSLLIEDQERCESPSGFCPMFDDPLPKGGASLGHSPCDCAHLLCTLLLRRAPAGQRVGAALSAPSPPSGPQGTVTVTQPPTCD